MIGSTEISRPTKPTGKFSALKTTMAVKVAPPPTPTVPKLASTHSSATSTRKATITGKEQWVRSVKTKVKYL